MPDLSPHEQRILESIDESWAFDRLVELVAIPSIGDSEAESDAQHRLAADYGRLGMNTDLWPIDLPEALGHPDFPGSEVPRTGAWGLMAAARAQ